MQIEGSRSVIIGDYIFFRIFVRRLVKATKKSARDTSQSLKTKTRKCKKTIQSTPNGATRRYYTR